MTVRFPVPVGRTVAALAVLAALVRPAVAVPPGDEEDGLSRFDGLEIVAVVIDRRDLFDLDDSETDSWPYRWANNLNIVTSEGFIRGSLLFEEGDTFDASLASESARILRSYGFLNPVEISAEETEGGVEVVVFTRDRWSLDIAGTFDIFGGQSETEIGFTDENFLGMGQEFGLIYESDEERSSYTVSYFNPLIAGRHIQARAELEDADDGHRYLLRGQRPFYSLQTRWATGFEWEDESLIEHLWSDNETVVDGRKDTYQWKVWGGLRLPWGGRSTTNRLVVGVEEHDYEYEGWAFVDTDQSYATPEDRFLRGIRIGYTSITDRFEVVRAFRAWEIQEDIALGPRGTASVLYSSPSFGGDRERWLFESRYRQGWHRGGWVVLGDLWAEGRYERGDVVNGLFGVEIAAGELGPKGWQFRLKVEETEAADRDLQLTLGADTGLRGWEADTFDGTGRALLNVQWRQLIWSNLADMISIGFVGFVDAGKTWDPRVGRDTGGVRANIGVGLLADVSKVAIAEAFRFEVAVPDDGSGYIITVSSSALF